MPINYEMKILPKKLITLICAGNGDLLLQFAVLFRKSIVFAV